MRYDDQTRLVAGVEFTGMVPAQEQILAAYIDARINPSVRHAAVEDLPHLWRLYQQTGLVSPTQKISAIEATRRTLLRRGGDAMVQVIGGAEGELQGTAEFLHTYPYSWSLQHVGMLANSRLTPDQLIVPALGSALQHQSFYFLHAILDPEQPSGLEALREITPSSDSLLWREWVLLTTAPGYGPPASLSEDMHDAEAMDLDWIDTKLAARSSPLERGALALDRANIDFAAVSHFYRSIGLERQRRIRMAVGISGPLGFSLIEQSSPGINFEGYGDLARIVPTTQLGASREVAALTLAHDAVAVQRDAKRRPLLLVAGDLEPILQQVGLSSLGRRVEIFADRDGASQVINFVNLLGSAQRR
jgi:hypothetical protein